MQTPEGRSRASAFHEVRLGEPWPATVPPRPTPDFRSSGAPVLDPDPSRRNTVILPVNHSYLHFDIFDCREADECMRLKCTSL